MAGSRKTVRKGFSYLECDDFAAYLEEMARKGWHFREWSAGLVFEKGERSETEYAVEVFIDGSEYDTRPEPHTKEFAEYCEAAGWHLVDAKQKYCIFKKMRPDAADILTDEERLETIAKEEQKNIWRHLGIAVVWSFMNLMYYAGSLFCTRIFDNGSLMITALWFVFLATDLVRCIHFYLWKHSAKQRLDRGEPIYFGKRQKGGLQFYGWHSAAVVGAFLVYMTMLFLLGQYDHVIMFLAYLAAFLILGYFIAKIRPDAVTNQLTQVFVSMFLFVGVMVVSLAVVYENNENKPEIQDAPFYAEDFGLDMGEVKATSGYVTTSVLGSNATYLISYEDSWFQYAFYQTEHQWILDRLWEEETAGKINETRTDCATQWGAEEAFCNGMSDYYIRYRDSFLVLTLQDGIVLTPEQIEVIRDKLDLR